MQMTGACMLEVDFYSVHQQRLSEQYLGSELQEELTSSRRMHTPSTGCHAGIPDPCGRYVVRQDDARAHRENCTQARPMIRILLARVTRAQPGHHTAKLCDPSAQLERKSMHTRFRLASAGPACLG